MNRRLFLRMGTLAVAGWGMDLTLGLWPGAGQAFAARGVTLEESARARRIFETMGVSTGGGSSRNMPSNGVVTLAPGEALTFERRGYCLDDSLSAPKRDEPLGFRPMSQYIAPELRELYVNLMHRVARAVPSGVDVQKIVWAMRAPAKGSWSEGFSSNEKNLLNACQPGGASLMGRAYRPPEYLSGYGTGGRRPASGGGGAGFGAGAGPADILGAVLPQLMSHLPFNVNLHSNDLMQQLLNRNAQRPMPDQEYCYSMLTDSGVAGYAVGMGGLDVRGTVANGSQTPFTLDAAQWVLESPRDVQAVALPPPNKISAQMGRALSGQGESRRLQDPARQEEHEEHRPQEHRTTPPGHSQPPSSQPQEKWGNESGGEVIF